MEGFLDNVGGWEGTGFMEVCVVILFCFCVFFVMLGVGRLVWLGSFVACPFLSPELVALIFFLLIERRFAQTHEWIDVETGEVGVSKFALSV